MSCKDQELNKMIVINTIASICCKNILAYLSADIIYSDKQFSESFKEPIMFKDKYRSIFSHQMGAIVFIFLEIIYIPQF